MDTYFVFDVESVGLHGPAFAVGWIVIDPEGTKQETGFAWCRPLDATGRLQRRTDREWVRDHCAWLKDDGLPAPTTETLMRDAFWRRWMYWKAQGAYLAADVCWPVEANFLTDCITDAPQDRLWEGPYPLLDIASVRWAAGLDPVATVERWPDEEPAHNPLMDARQSARLLVEALEVTNTPSPSPRPLIPPYESRERNP